MKLIKHTKPYILGVCYLKYHLYITSKSLFVFFSDRSMNNNEVDDCIELIYNGLCFFLENDQVI